MKNDTFLYIIKVITNGRKLAKSNIYKNETVDLLNISYVSFRHVKVILISI